MLFYHIKYAIKMQHNKKQKKEANVTEDDNLGPNEESKEEEND